MVDLYHTRPDARAVLQDVFLAWLQGKKAQALAERHHHSKVVAALTKERSQLASPSTGLKLQAWEKQENQTRCDNLI